MTWALVVPFVAALALVGLTRFANRRMEPRAASWSITASSGVIAVATTGSLALAAWPLAARLPTVARLGEWSASAVSRTVPIPLPMSVCALALLVTVAGRLVRNAVAIRASAAQVWSTHRSCAATAAGPLIVVDDARLMAYAIPGLTTIGGRTLVTSGLLAALHSDERQAVLAHERAHLAHRHHLFAVVLDVAVSLNPFLAPARNEARFALERWADEVAASETTRSTVGRALAKTALGQLDRIDTPRPTPSILLQAGDRRVSARIVALLDGVPERRPSVHRLVLASALVAVIAVAWASHDMERAFETVRLLR